MFTGAITALVTPFRDGAINKPAYETHVAWQVEQGIAGLVACGTTAEVPTLTQPERDWLLRAAVVTAAGRVPVIAGIGTSSTSSTVEQARLAQSLGADALLVVTPYYNRPSQEGLFRHFEAVSQATDLPVILYNVPARTGIDLEPETVARLSRVDGIVGIKDATGDRLRPVVTANLVDPDFVQLAGDDRTAFDFMLSGGRGSISVVSNAFPGDWSALCTACERREFPVAMDIAERLAPLLDALARESNPAPIKYALSLLRRSQCAEVRLPLVPVGAITAACIRSAIDDLTRSKAA